jgi:methionyl-tRNA formyltransferase
VAYGEIIKQNVLDMPRLGCVNVHASLLPKYRGAAPMQRALMAGETETGVTLIEMAPQMDAGAVLGVEKVPIPSGMTRGELETALRAAACPLLLRVLQEMEAGVVRKVPQDHAQATYAPKITSEEGEIHWERPAVSLHHLVCALSPQPAAWCWVYAEQEKKMLKIRRTSVVDMHGRPGEVLAFDKSGWVVACASGALRLLEVQLEGKRSMTAAEFIAGARVPMSFTHT